MRPTSQTKQEKTVIRPSRRGDQAPAKRLILSGLVEHWGTLDPTLNLDLDDIASTYADAGFLVAWHGQDLVGTGAPVAEQVAAKLERPVAAAAAGLAEADSSRVARHFEEVSTGPLSSRLQGATPHAQGPIDSW